jgi:hypothetical protein
MELLDKRCLDVFADSELWRTADTIAWLELIDKIEAEGI